MKKTELRKIIKESIKELMNEQSPGNSSGPYPPNFNPNNWTQTFDHDMGAGGHPAGQYSNDGPPPNNSNVNCTKINNRWNNWSNKISISTHQKQKNMLMLNVIIARGIHIIVGGLIQEYVDLVHPVYK